MAFNHYAKIKRILENENGWIIKRIDQPTSAKKFNGETVKYSYYYRIYDSKGKAIKFCKFQQIERLGKALGVKIEELPVIDQQ